MAHRDILRIAREVADIQKGTDLSIAVANQDSNVRRVQALVIGPPGTPYEYGFFHFAVKFSRDYPSKPPKVEARTTNRGQCRFNPNIYAGGKVCLSILGTWQGEAGEQWSAAQGLESVLLSIQSLMSNNPYENEPGYEKSKGEVDKDVREAYCAKIRHETLRIAVIQKLEVVLRLDKPAVDAKAESLILQRSSSSEEDGDDVQPKSDKSGEPLFEPFNDLQKRRFLWYYDIYLTTIMENAPKYRDGIQFQQMQFEHEGNAMQGKFQYNELGKRLLRIRQALQEETESWETEGKSAANQDLNIAYNLRNQFNQLATYQRERNIHNIDISLHDGNPFVWMMTYFGRTGSNLDGGMFRIRINISVRFPEEQPRVRFETKIYHHRVSRNGVLCYFPDKPDEMKHHVEAIVFAIEEIQPPYDPRAIVHPEATKLLWGNESDKKKYNRAQRRSAQDSMDEPNP